MNASKVVPAAFDIEEESYPPPLGTYYLEHRSSLPMIRLGTLFLRSILHRDRIVTGYSTQGQNSTQRLGQAPCSEYRITGSVQEALV